MGGICTCARADEERDVSVIVERHSGQCPSPYLTASTLESLHCVSSPEPLSTQSIEHWHDAVQELDTTEGDGLDALLHAPFAFARYAASGCQSGNQEEADKCSARAVAEGAKAIASGDASLDDSKPEDVRALETQAARFGNDFWGGAGGSSTSSFATLKQLFHLRNVDLSRFSGVPISQHVPVSSCEILHRYTFMDGRAPPLQRLAAHMRLELPVVLHAGRPEGQLHRFMVILRAHFSLLDAPAQSLRKPFNPVLGEVSRALQCAGPGAPITSVCEQVSHHPPVTAFACWDPELQWEYDGWTDISPRFMGTYIRVPFTGHRALTIRSAGEPQGQETYNATIPAMEWHLFPSVRALYSGTWHLWCPESGLAAEIIHPGAGFLSGLIAGQKRTRIHGRITRVAAGANPLDAMSDDARVRRAAGASTLFSFDGDFDGVIVARNYGESASASGGTVIWDVDRETIIEARLQSPRLTPELEPRSSSAVWGQCIKALLDRDWDNAAAKKAAVEQEERRARRAREQRGETWQSRWFMPMRDVDWVPKP